MKKGTFFVVVMSVLCLTACALATGITEVAVSNPALSEDEVIPQKTNKTFYINSISDDRVFEKAPKTPDIPSLDITKYDKSRAVGRKRNMYGKALGGFLLRKGQTVESLARQVVKAVAKKNGYNVLTSKEEVNKNTVIADISITKTWEWTNVTFTHMAMSANVEYKIKLTKNNATEEITVNGKELEYVHTRERDFVEALNLAFKNLYDDISLKFQNYAENQG